LFIPDPNPYFLPILDPRSWGQKGTGSRIRNTEVKVPVTILYLDGIDGLLESRPAGAPLHIVHDHALRVRSARVRIARFDRLHTGDGGRVALEPRQAEADGLAANQATARVRAAHVALAGRPVGDAAHEGVAGLAARARADGVPVVHLADRVGAAGRGYTGVCRWEDNGAAAHVWVPGKSCKR
jgi:hypothetical protein